MNTPPDPRNYTHVPSIFLCEVDGWLAFKDAKLNARVPYLIVSQSGIGVWFESTNDILRSKHLSAPEETRRQLAATINLIDP